MQQYVIESATHGTYTGIDWSRSGNSYGPRFAVAGKRTDGMIFWTVEEARNAVKRIKAFKDPNWKRQAWIDRIYIVEFPGAKIIEP